MPPLNYQRVQGIFNESAIEDGALARAITSARAQLERFETFAVRQPKDAFRFAAEPDSDDYELVIVAGGDGTLNEVVNGLATSKRLDNTAMAVLPYGTANDFAAHLDLLNLPIRDLLEATLNAHATPADLGLAGDRLFINAASGGIGASATTDAAPELKKSLGKFAYFISGIMHAGEITGSAVSIRGDEFEWSGETVGFVVANGSYVGGNIRVAPEASIEDGLLDLMLVPMMPTADLVSLAAQHFLPGPERPESIVRVRSSVFEIHAEETMQVNLDGEKRTADQFRFEVLPGRLRLCCPKFADAS